jgi:hypothetical protein
VRDLGVHRSYRLSVDLSGIIFVVLALAWAGYLIPKALKHHDEVARTRSIDRFSTTMRVLARREPVNRGDSRLVVTPARATDNPRMLVPSRTPSVPPAARRAAAKAAARRRRRILAFLLLADIVLGVLAGLVVVPLWSAGIPVALTVLYLVLCRTQVRREDALSWADDAVDNARDADVDVAPRRAVRVDTSHGTPAEAVAAARNAQGFEEVSPDEDTVSMPAELLDAVVVPTADGGSLWDPLPVTLPTYVNKPKARRTVRTIDLNEPGAWTSGRTEADARLVQESQAEGDEGEPPVEEQHAVGS